MLFGSTATGLNGLAKMMEYLDVAGDDNLTNMAKVWMQHLPNKTAPDYSVVVGNKMERENALNALLQSVGDHLTNLVTLESVSGNDDTKQRFVHMVEATFQGVKLDKLDKLEDQVSSAIKAIKDKKNQKVSSGALVQQVETTLKTLADAEAKKSETERKKADADRIALKPAVESLRKQLGDRMPLVYLYGQLDSSAEWSEDDIAFAKKAADKYQEVQKEVGQLVASSSSSKYISAFHTQVHERVHNEILSKMQDVVTWISRKDFQNPNLMPNLKDLHERLKYTANTRDSTMMREYVKNAINILNDCNARGAAPSGTKAAVITALYNRERDKAEATVEEQRKLVGDALELMKIIDNAGGDVSTIRDKLATVLGDLDKTGIKDLQKIAQDIKDVYLANAPATPEQKESVLQTVRAWLGDLWDESVIAEVISKGGDALARAKQWVMSGEWKKVVASSSKETQDAFEQDGEKVKASDADTTDEKLQILMTEMGTEWWRRWIAKIRIRRVLHQIKGGMDKTYGKLWAFLHSVNDWTMTNDQHALKYVVWDNLLKVVQGLVNDTGVEAEKLLDALNTDLQDHLLVRNESAVDAPARTVARLERAIRNEASVRSYITQRLQLVADTVTSLRT